MEENRNMPEQTSEQELSELLQIRRDKLAALQAAGKNPFEITRFDRDALNNRKSLTYPYIVPPKNSRVNK